MHITGGGFLSKPQTLPPTIYSTLPYSIGVFGASTQLY